MRDTFEKLFWDNKSVRMGELLKFTGTIGGKRKDLNVLITDVYLIDERYFNFVFEDHVWLGTFNFYGESLKELLKCKMNKGKKVIFTAKVLPYSGKTNYGLKLDKNSIVEIL